MHTLAHALKDWDQKSVDTLLQLYQQYTATVGFVQELIELLNQQEQQTGASWLLKHHLEGGHLLTDNECLQVYQQALGLTAWPAKLHLLQSIPFMPIPACQKDPLERFLRSCLIDTNKFVRAWAYNGFHELSLQFPEFLPESQQFIEMALRDEAPSVKARIRAILRAKQ